MTDRVVCDACWDRRGGGGAPPRDCPECGGLGMVDRPPDLQAIRERLGNNYALYAPHGFNEAWSDVGSLLAEVDRQAAEIERLRDVSQALEEELAAFAGWTRATGGGS